MFFQYGQAEIDYLKKKDKTLGKVIDTLGHIDREVRPGLFPSVVHSILGQQISTKAHVTICGKLEAQLGEITPDAVLKAGREQLQMCGTTFRKADYILDFARRVQLGEIDLNALAAMPDDAFVRALSSLKGVGVWTAEMTLLFCLQRPDVFSYGDLAIRRGLRMVYHHRDITPERFEMYRRRFSPCCSVASLYLWAIAGGAIPGMKDYGR